MDVAADEAAGRALRLLLENVTDDHGAHDAVDIVLGHGLACGPQPSNPSVDRGH